MPIVFARTAAHAPELPPGERRLIRPSVGLFRSFRGFPRGFSGCSPRQDRAAHIGTLTNFFLIMSACFVLAARTLATKGRSSRSFSDRETPIPGDPDLALRLQHCHANGFEPNHAQENEVRPWNYGAVKL